MTRSARESQGHRAGAVMLHLSLLHRAAPGGRILSAGAAILALLLTTQPLVAQQRDSSARDSIARDSIARDSSARDSSARRGIQVISPEAGRRRAAVAGTIIAGEHPAGPLSFAPDSAPELSDLLTAREIERMGLARLSAAEQAELARWIVQRRGIGRMGMMMGPRAWTIPLSRRFPAASRVELVEHGDPRSAVSIADVAAGGSLVVLGDGTIWEVYLPDRVRTDAWSSGESVRVRRASVAVGGFDHELLNGGEADRALVRFRGRSDVR
jgi:hypothetical protein